MVRSMTGYGSYEKLTEEGSLRIRLRSVNRKGLDISLTLPTCWHDFEGPIREQISQRLHRGSIAAYIDFERAAGSAAPFDESAWQQLVLTVDRAKEHSSWSREEVIAALAASGAFATAPQKSDSQARELSDSKYLKWLQQGVSQAMDHFEAFREKEGEALKKIMLDLLFDLESMLKSMKERLLGVVERHMEKLQQRLQQLGVHQVGDPARWHLELALLADRMDVTEETDRLALHINHFRDLLHPGGQAVGRKLDFLTQEMMREINTLMNKSQDAQLTPIGIEFKAAIERLREQLQNVE